MTSRFALIVGIALLSGCSSTPSSSELKEAVRNPANAVAESTVTYATRLEEVDPDFVKQATPAEIQAVEALIKMLSVQVNIVQMPFTLYHYAPPEQVTPKSLPANATDPAGFRLFRSKADKFWSNQQMGSAAGNGLYLAADPKSSSNFRKDDDTFLLLLVTPRSGMRILDTRMFSMVQLPEVLKRFNEFGCPSEIFSFSNFATSEKCGKFLKIAIKALRISLIEYPYGASHECERRSTAFVAVDSSAFSPKDVNLLMGNPNFKDPKTMRLAWETYSLSPEVFLGWEKKFRKRKPLDEKEIRNLREATFVSCPKVRYHLASATGLSDSEIASLRKTSIQWIAQNRDLPVPGVYCGRPLIHIESVQYARHWWSSFSSSDSDINVATFCNGSPTCSYSKHFVRECEDEKTCGTIKIDWECVPSCGIEDKRSQVFDLSKTSTFDISCDKTGNEISAPGLH